MDDNNKYPRWEQRYESYKKALGRLTTIVNESKKRPLNEFEQDSMIQRFEFTHELAWKLMKAYAEYQGELGITGSRDAIRWACNNHIAENGQVWLEMLRSRNETSHDYDEQLASETITKIVNSYYSVLSAFELAMAKKIISQSKDLFE
ncbi:MAG: nucleotidyltransferase substrate binding protein [Paludibacteraceae bacterium]|nr:nucleotidyltransferase substrate binding protein [Paludibacteraceae bacterium]